MPQAIVKKSVLPPFRGKHKGQEDPTSVQVLSRMVAAVVDSVSDGIFLLHPRGREFYIQDANRTMAGLLQTKLVGRYIQEVLPLEEWQRLRPLLRVLSQPGCKSRCVRTSFRTKTGEAHQIKLRLEPICVNGKLEALVGTVKVLTQNVKIQKENRELRQRFAASFEYAPYGVCFIDSYHRPSLANNALAQMLGRSGEALQSKRIEDLVHQEDRAVFARALKKVFDGERTYDGIEVRMVGADGQAIWVAMSISLAHYGQQHMHYAILQTLDITARKMNEAELLRMATKDHLTGVDNRLVFDRRLKEAISNARRYGRKGAVLFIDLDNFKMVNDSFGHKVGDAVLKAVARCASNILRSTDMLARLGGDEFAVILEEVGGHDAEKKAREMRAAICGLKVPLSDGQFLDVNASIGVKWFDGTDVDLSAETIIHAADRAMYEQKGLTKSKSLVSLKAQ